jgi:hypothetical protein
MGKKEIKTKCPYCKVEISFNEKVCPHCGKSLKLNNIMAGIVLGIIVIGAVIAIVTGGGNSSLQKGIETKLGVSSEKAKEINNILIGIGLDNFDSITNDEILNNTEAENSKGYRIKTSFSDNVILYMDSSNNIISIRWADKDFYKDGQTILNFKDYTITFDEENNYNIDAQDRIKKVLKAPSTAKFPSITKWGFTKDNGVVTVSAYVDSENSFGAMLRSNFQIKYAKDGAIMSLIFDGKEYIK